MCTAATYQARDFYFGRTLDYEFSYGEEIVVMPRRFPLNFQHYALVGMAHVAEGTPLFYDAINEKGLGMAGLNFVGNADYKSLVPGKDNVASFEFIPWILGQCANLEEARQLLARMNLVSTPFAPSLPASQLHWLIADSTGAITVECVKEGLKVYDNPAGVMTNNPPFPAQMMNLNNFMHLSRKQPENHFSGNLPLQCYSRGMGALGLPGDLSSQSRFVRVAFVRANSVSGTGEGKASASSSTFSALWTSSGAAARWTKGNLNTPSIPPAATPPRASTTTPPMTITRLPAWICTRKIWMGIRWCSTRW